MDNNLRGGYVVLASLPIWATITIFYLLTLFVVDAGREIFEGFSYNVSFAAKYADVGLLVCIIIGATILKRGPVLAGWMSTVNFQIICGAIVMLICLAMICSEVVMFKNSVSRQLVDIYHNIIIMPLFVYLLLILIPVIYTQGTCTEKAATVIFLLLWVGLMIYDIKDGRLNQREWLVKKGYECILK